MWCNILQWWFLWKERISRIFYQQECSFLQVVQKIRKPSGSSMQFTPPPDHCMALPLRLESQLCCPCLCKLRCQPKLLRFPAIRHSLCVWVLSWVVPLPAVPFGVERSFLFSFVLSSFGWYLFTSPCVCFGFVSAFWSFPDLFPWLCPLSSLGCISFSHILMYDRALIVFFLNMSLPKLVNSMLDRGVFTEQIWLALDPRKRLDYNHACVCLASDERNDATRRRRKKELNNCAWQIEQRCRLRWMEWRNG
jgi:hypothetical protein